MACLFTSSGANARKFRNQADAEILNQHWGGCTNGAISFQWMERQLFW